MDVEYINAIAALAAALTPVAVEALKNRKQKRATRKQKRRAS